MCQCAKMLYLYHNFVVTLLEIRNKKIMVILSINNDVKAVCLKKEQKSEILSQKKKIIAFNLVNLQSSSKMFI